MFQPRVRTRWTDYAVVVLFALVIVVANVCYVSRINRGVRLDDDGAHVRLPLELEQDLRDARGVTEGVISLLDLSNQYPPVVYLAMAAGFYVAGPTVATVVAVMGGFLVLLAVSIYGWCSILGGRRFGLACAFAITASPDVLFTSRNVLLGLPLVAVAALVLWCAAASRNFSLARPALATGAALGLALLTKDSAAVCLLPWLLPVMVGVLYASFRGHPAETARLLGLLMLTVTAWLVACHRVLAGHGGHVLQEEPLKALSLVLLAASGAFVVVLYALVRRRWCGAAAPATRSAWHVADALFVAAMVTAPWYLANAAGVLAHYQGAVGDRGLFTPARVLLEHAAALTSVVWLYPENLLLTVISVACYPFTGGVAARLLVAAGFNFCAAAFVSPLARFRLPMELYVVPLVLLWLVVFPRAAAWVATALACVALFQAGAFCLGPGLPRQIPVRPVDPNYGNASRGDLGWLPAVPPCPAYYRPPPGPLVTALSALPQTQDDKAAGSDMVRVAIAHSDNFDIMPMAMLRLDAAGRHLPIMWLDGVCATDRLNAAVVIFRTPREREGILAHLFGAKRFQLTVPYHWESPDRVTWELVIRPGARLSLPRSTAVPSGRWAA